MKKLTVYLFCMCLILSGFVGEVSAGELTKKAPLTQSEVNVLAQGDTGAIDHIVAGGFTSDVVVYVIVFAGSLAVYTLLYPTLFGSS